MPSIINT